MAITFREIKYYISRVVRISICFQDGNYENYTMISDIADELYDDLYVYGIGMVDVEFPLDVYRRPKEGFQKTSPLENGYRLGCGLEIVLQNAPRNIPRQDELLLRFGDLREYLQIGVNFSVVMREDWSVEQFMWRKDIPKQYDDLYVYGIGIEDIYNGTESEQYTKVYDTHLMKQMILVLTKTPRVNIV